MSRIGPVSRQCPTVSVVIATVGRRQCLPNCIASLRRQTYRPLELVVVVGPSEDGSHAYASSLGDVKVTRVDRLNASFARNTGLRLASGDIIAFIDDDAIATPTWLEELVRVFEAEGPTCGGVAGLVVNENGPGRPVQAMNNTINDLGEPIECRLAPSGFNDPESDEFVYFMGANMAVRREAILAVGGFDETYFYPYEDADLSVAIIKAGYRLFHHPKALVHHLPALSHNRRSAFDSGYYAGARHKMYFCLKFSKRTNWECFRGVVRGKIYLIREFIQLTRRGHIPLRDAVRFTWNTIRGVTSGLKAGLQYRREGRIPVHLPEYPRPEFLPLKMDSLPRPPRRRQRQSLRLALLCGEFGNAVYGGVGVYTAHLAEALASRGHEVTVFRSRIGPCRIEPAGYRVVDVPFDWDPVRERHAFLMALHREADRREIDLVESPLWSGNGAAVGSAALAAGRPARDAICLDPGDVGDRVQPQREDVDSRRAASTRLRHGHYRDQRGGRLDGRIHLSRPAVVSRPTSHGHSPGIALGGPHPVPTVRDADLRRDAVPLHRPVRGAQRRARTGQSVCQRRPSGHEGDALARRCR